MVGGRPAFARKPVVTDLRALFGRLGILLQADGNVRFDEKAELADLRRRITAGGGIAD